MLASVRSAIAIHSTFKVVVFGILIPPPIHQPWNFFFCGLLCPIAALTNIIPFSYFLQQLRMVFHSGRMARLVGTSSGTPEVCWFDSGAGHMPKLQVQPGGDAYKGNRSMSLSHVNVSLSLPLSLKINGNVSSGEDF